MKLNLPGSFHYKILISPCSSCLSSWCGVLTYIYLAIDHSRVSSVDGSELVRADLIGSRKYGACGQAGGLDLCFGETLEWTADCPVVAEGFEVEGVVEPALHADAASVSKEPFEACIKGFLLQDSTGVEGSACFESFDWTFDWSGDRQV